MGFVLQRDELPVLSNPESTEGSLLMFSSMLFELNRSISVLQLLSSLLFSVLGRFVVLTFDKASFNVVESAAVADVVEGESIFAILGAWFKLNIC